MSGLYKLALAAAQSARCGDGNCFNAERPQVHATEYAFQNQPMEACLPAVDAHRVTQCMLPSNAGLDARRWAQAQRVDLRDTALGGCHSSALSAARGRQILIETELK